MRPLILASAFVVTVAVACRTSTSNAPAPAAATVPDITAADLEHRLEIIAHDSMMGRETGSEGDYKTAAYVASEFKRLGLEPAGENGTYFQTVPFWRVGADPGSRVSVGNTELQLRRDFLPAVFTVPMRTMPVTHAVFAGMGNDQAHWIPESEARDRIVVVGVPAGMSPRGFPVPPARFPGAAAIVIAGLEQVSSEQAARIIEGRPVLDTSYNEAWPAFFYVTRPAARLMLGGAPDALEPGAIGPEMSARIGFTRTPIAFPARNVIGILRGSDPSLRGEYVALTAHNDHVGFDHFPVDHDSIRAFDRVIRPMGADSPPREPTAAEWAQIRTILDSLRGVHRPRLDSIRNGADDDGSGTVSLLEIAEAMAHARPRPRRSILFVSHTAEEAGLLGSAWFTDHATVPVDSIVAEIDQDMVGRGLPSDVPHPNGEHATATYLEVVGDQKLSMAFAHALELANSRQPLPFAFDRSYAAPGHPLQYYCRADHYNYARYGIPAVALSRGEHLDYHQVTDEAQYISYPDLARVSKLVNDAAMLLANADERPALDVAKPSNPHAPCRQ